MKKEKILFLCALIGCFADAIAILMSINKFTIAVPLLIFALVLLLIVIVQLYNKYIDRRDFLDFIEHLFQNNTHNFNLLPKICLALDKSKEINQLHVREMTVKYTYDMSKIDFSILSPETFVGYTDTIEYTLNVENKKLPTEFICYRGNMYADDYIDIKQKHGSQVEYEKVPVPRYTDETKTSSIVQRYCWQLKNEYITRSRLLPISIKIKYHEKARANSNDTIILYPKQYAQKIEKINFEINFNCEKNIIERIELFKIWKDNKILKNTPITGINMLNNKATISLHPDSTKYEAYYFRVYWKLCTDSNVDSHS